MDHCGQDGSRDLHSYGDPLIERKCNDGYECQYPDIEQRDTVRVNASRAQRERASENIENGIVYLGILETLGNLQIDVPGMAKAMDAARPAKIPPRSLSQDVKAILNVE